jgi:hypothetical protein
MATMTPIPRFTGTRESQIAQYQAWIDAHYPGVISNSSDRANDGLTWGGYYSKVASSPFSAPYSPFQLAEGVIGELEIGKVPAALATGINTGVGGLGSVATGVETAQLFPSWSSGLTSFLSFLGNRSSWIRIAEGVIGTLLILAAVSSLAAGTPAGKLAAKVPLI